MCRGKVADNKSRCRVESVTRATLKSFNPPGSLAFTGIAATRLVLSLFDSSNSIKNQATGSGIFFWKSRSKKQQLQQQRSPSIRAPTSPFVRSPPRHFRSIDDSLDLEEEAVIQSVRVDYRQNREGREVMSGSKRGGNNLEIVALPHSPIKHVTISTSPQPLSPHDPTSGILVRSESDNNLPSPTTYPPAPSPTSPRTRRQE
jgi:hypothetical protein